MGVTPQGDHPIRPLVTYFMDSINKTKEVEQSSKNAQPSGSKTGTVSLETEPKLQDASGATGPRNVRSHSGSETDTTDLFENDTAEAASQKSLDPAVVSNIRLLNLSSQGFRKFENLAQSKAFKRALKAGKTRAEALELAEKAVPGPSSMPRKEMKEKGRTKGPTLSYSSALKCTKLGIIAADTDEHLSNEELGKVADAILSEVRKNDDPNRKLLFQGTSQKSGWLQVNCGNPETTEWLLTKAKAIGESTGLSLKVVEQTNFPLPHLVRGFFPGCKEDSTEVIKEFLKAQSWLPTEKWQAVSRLTADV